MGDKERSDLDLRISHFSLGDDDLMLLSFSTDVDEVAAQLTKAERAVLRHVVRGLSNSQIAKLRKTSQNTVANQISSLFEKVGVSSRAELLAKVRASSK